MLACCYNAVQPLTTSIKRRARSSAITEGARDALRQSTSCHNCCATPREIVLEMALFDRPYIISLTMCCL